ncbi:MAG: DinB family protein [Actinomycetota bacterium]|nr:DinB family protein [Actinomycetota bacterium]
MQPDVPGDVKDWTWVLQRPCRECGLTAADVPLDDVAPRLRGNTAGWLRVLAEPGVRERPRPQVWSPLEYACHVRDVHRVYDGRLTLMLEQDDPLYPDWDQDATARAARYAEQDPARVAVALQEAGDRLAGRFAALVPAQWERPGRRSDGACFTVASFARYFLHDVLHHAWDVTGVPAPEQPR